MRFSYLLLFVLNLSFSSLLLSQTSIPEDYQLIYAQDFESPQAINGFEMTDSEAWKISKEETGNSLELFGKSNYKPPVRSPFNIALIKDVLVGDFTFEVDLNQTGKEYGHRDLCLFFGVNSPTNFYYVHIASIASNHTNNIFIVNDEARVKIATKTTSGTNWGEQNSWHKVKIEREVVSGSIKIYFDDMKNPIMEATDIHFKEGRIGLGSFDDTGKFDNVKIWSNAIIENKKDFFK